MASGAAGRGEGTGGFGSGGRVLSPVGEVVTAAVIQADGKIVAVGTHSDVGGKFALARYLRNGKLDRAFGKAAQVRTRVGIRSTRGGIGDAFANAAAIQPNGKIVVAGQSSVRWWDFALARYRPNGSLDS